VSLRADEQDLTYLNRDLSKVILLDTNPEHAALQPDNAIIIPPWDGKGGENGLVELIPFLECESAGGHHCQCES
jgi:import inner membrane translocase subunit TIM50